MAASKEYFQQHYAKNKERIKARVRKYKQANPARYEDSRLQRAFGITLEDYNNMLLVQEGVCAICKKPESVWWRKKGQPKRLTVDHCHVSGRVRGLLCQKCNSILGYAEDEPLRLIEAAKYLGRNRGNS